jgi:hypothetical protein
MQITMQVVTGSDARRHRQAPHLVNLDAAGGLLKPAGRPN